MFASFFTSASQSRVFLSTDRCSLPESKRSVVIVKTGVSVRMMRNELRILSRWFSYNVVGNVC